MPALMTEFSTSMERATSGLVRTCELEPSLARRVCELELATERYLPGEVIAPAGAPAQLKWILDGWACEARDLSDGRRQIFSFAIPGDLVRPAESAGHRAVVAMTAVDCVDMGPVLARADEGGQILQAIGRSLALAHGRRYEHLSRLTWRSALQRMASLLIELHDRLEQVALVQGDRFALPLRHEDLADALGLSPAHVTRSLRVLREKNLLTLQFRRVTRFDREGLEAVCEA